ncbi:Metallo-dependent phosphatase [Hymenopellis radicata]|nr:Metallo-dependent phosphatase [Hymenopellis radicata]
MYDQLQSLLHKLSYDHTSDTLISVGDIVAKGSHKGSMAVLSYMSSHNITAVRGNHDQKVIEWQSWLQWIRSLPGGPKFLETARAKWLEAMKNGADDVELWVEKQIKQDKDNSKWWKRIPSGWTLFGDHFEIAHAMSDEEYDYLVSRPLKLHIPHAHAFVAHAGILASDPRYNPWHKNQPLAKVPLGKSIPVLRRLQEGAILSDVPQNLDPWVTLNMRGVKNKQVTRGKDGTAWSKLYKQDMKMCHGFEQSLYSTSHDKENLPCIPATVVYGHAASRGLDVKRWTIGIDTGCVYENRLTALVLGGRYAGVRLEDDEDVDDDDYEEEIEIDGKKRKSVVKFGDNGRGKLVSVSCS